MTRKPKKLDSRSSSTAETIKTVLWAAAIAIFVRTFLYEPFNIPSSSMVPTLLIGDYLFVSKTELGYGRYSFPWGLVPVEGRIWAGAPLRGDVVVFRPPGEPETDFIKRVIGLPGDRIQVREGRLFINGTELQRRRIEDYVNPDNPYAGAIPQYIETLPEGIEHRIIEADGDRGSLDNTPIYVVPADHYFMMGDNRDRSNDSRVLKGGLIFDLTSEVTDGALLDKVGFVPAANFVGPAKILFWSFDGSFGQFNPITWVTALRWWRLGSLVK